MPIAPAAPVSALPVEPRQYHEFLRTPRMRWWRPVLALLMAGALWFGASMVLSLPAIFYDVQQGNTTWDEVGSGKITVTPALFLANNLALAASIPIAVLTQWACFGQRPRWLSSVLGGFRWRWFGECVVWVLPVIGAHIALDLVISDLPELGINPNTGFMIAAILLTTPLQAAGEEYLLRGLGQRAIAAWLPRTAGLLVSTGVTALIFMWMHGAGDPWLNAFYLLFAVAASVLSWRTGGLEAACAVHIVNNVLAMLLLPFTDFSGMFDREAGVGSPVVLLQMAVMAAAVAVIWGRAKLRGVVTEAAPGAALPAG